VPLAVKPSYRKVAPRGPEVRFWETRVLEGSEICVRSSAFVVYAYCFRRENTGKVRHWSPQERPASAECALPPSKRQLAVQRGGAP
jgi:hypothetical protein